MQNLQAYESRRKSLAIAYILWFFPGWLGIWGHYFYFKQNVIGVISIALHVAFYIARIVSGETQVWLILGLVLVVWRFLDLILIPLFVRDYNRRLIRRFLLTGGDGLDPNTDISVVEKNLKLAKEYFNEGLKHADDGAFKSATLSFSKAIELIPNHAEAYLNRGIEYADNGDSEQAVADFSKAIEINPDYPDAHLNLARSYKEEGNYSEAKQNLETALRLASEQMKDELIPVIQGELGSLPSKT